MDTIDFRPPDLEIHLVQGITAEFAVTVTDQDDQAVDLSAATLRLRIKRDISNATPDLELTTGSGISVGGAGSNVVSVTLAAAQTAALLPTDTDRRYRWDMEATSASGKVVPIRRGTIQVDRDV